MLGPVVPPGYYPAFSTVSSDDHSAWIIIATVLGMVYTIIFAGFRAFVSYTTGRNTGLDDMALYVGTILAVIQSIINLVACSYGLGKSIRIIPSGQIEDIQKMFYAVKLIFIVALGISKISVFLLLKQLSPQPRHRKVFWGIVGFIAVWTVASLLALAVQCDFMRPWIVVGPSCSRGQIFLRWQIISAFDVLIEVAAVVSILFIVWHLQTSWSNKATVGGAFALRFAMIIPIAFRLRTFSNEGIHADPTLEQSRFIIWTQTELHFSLISATIPCLRPVINRLVTHYGALGPAESTGYGSNNSRGRRQSYQLSSFKQSIKSRDNAPERSRSVKGRDGAYSYDIETSGGSSSTTGGAKRINSVASVESRQMIITKQLSWKVESETVHEPSSSGSAR